VKIPKGLVIKSRETLFEFIIGDIMGYWDMSESKVEKSGEAG
jgi:hypothetical protein